MDSIHRQAEPDVETAKVEASNQAKPVITAEVPYLDYTQSHGHPYTVDYFKLGDSWDDPHGGFPIEISNLEGYLKSQIESGELPNSRTAIEKRIKEMEKVNNLTGEERSLVKIETLSAYVKFLSKKDDIKANLRRYGNL